MQKREAVAVMPHTRGLLLGLGRRQADCLVGWEGSAVTGRWCSRDAQELFERGVVVVVV